MKDEEEKAVFNDTDFYDEYQDDKDMIIGGVMTFMIIALLMTIVLLAY